MENQGVQVSRIENNYNTGDEQGENKRDANL